MKQKSFVVEVYEQEKSRTFIVRVPDADPQKPWKAVKVSADPDEISNYLSTVDL